MFSQKDLLVLLSIIHSEVNIGTVGIHVLNIGLDF